MPVSRSPRSFDPVTPQRANPWTWSRTLSACATLIVSHRASEYPAKSRCFSTEERLEMVHTVFARIAAKAGCEFELHHL
jgi:phosphopantetheine adenylyltransferase